MEAPTVSLNTDDLNNFMAKFITSLSLSLSLMKFNWSPSEYWCSNLLYRGPDLHQMSLHKFVHFSELTGNHLCLDKMVGCQERVLNWKEARKYVGFPPIIRTHIFDVLEPFGEWSIHEKSFRNISWFHCVSSTAFLQVFWFYFSAFNNIWPFDLILVCVPFLIPMLIFRSRFREGLRVPVGGCGLQ